MEDIYTTLDLERRASVEELKASLLEMLLAFDAFCKEHSLTYYLSGGTLLGAVRHKGFIPWDDDIDVNMPRPDCERLMELSGGKIGKFTLVPPNNNTYTFAYHWKLYGDDVLISKRANGKESGIGNKIYPAFMDIFPIEGLPEDYARAEAHYDQIRQVKRKARFQSFLQRYCGRNPFQKLKYKLAHIYFRYFAVTNYHDEVIKLAKKYDYASSDHIGVMMTDVHGIVERVDKDDYTPVIYMEFEGKQVQCPAGYDTYLRQLYGPDYMTVLPPHKQVSRHLLVPFKRRTMAQIDPLSVPAPEREPAAEEVALERAAFHAIRGKIEETYTTSDLDRLAGQDELQSYLLKILLEFDSFCRKHGLNYYLSGQSLLGAVRHQGFAPWANDLRVNMPRPDCEKLLRLSGGMIGDYTLIPPNSAARTFSFHWKLSGEDIVVTTDPGGSDNGLENSIRPAALDIYPEDGLPTSLANARTHHRCIRLLTKKARQQAFATRYRGRNPIRKLRFTLSQFHLQYFDVTNYHDRATKLAKAYPYDTAEQVGVVVTNTEVLVERMKKSDCVPVIEMDFEGHSVRAPAGFERYLERLFGENFMDEVPPHKQFPKKDLAAFKTVKSAKIDPASLADDENEDSDQSIEVR